jgi:hypothetical protein
MENIEKALNLLHEIRLSNNEDLMDRVGLNRNIDLVEQAARKELGALKAAGIEVTIEQVEKVKVVKTKPKRGRKAKAS